jgi:hypothetical protein
MESTKYNEKEIDVYKYFQSYLYPLIINTDYHVKKNN